jgi:hypothetical protein
LVQKQQQKIIIIIIIIIIIPETGTAIIIKIIINYALKIFLQ